MQHSRYLLLFQIFSSNGPDSVRGRDRKGTSGDEIPVLWWSFSLIRPPPGTRPSCRVGGWNVRTCNVQTFERNIGHGNGNGHGWSGGWYLKTQNSELSTLSIEGGARYPFTMTFPWLPPPSVPSWIDDELPFNRRVFAGGGQAIHFIDHGDGPPILLLHGNPTWCYLWRKVIGILAAEHVRVIAPDLVGFGLSDKPRDPKIHTLDFHVCRISALVQALDLRDLTIAGQDWGGPISAVMAARNPDRIRGAVFANTGIRVPNHPPRVTPFHRFSRMPAISDLAFRHLNLLVRGLRFAQGDRSSIGPTERRAYLYPFRRLRDRAAPLALARLVPTSLSSPVYRTLQEADDWARSFTGPVRLVWGLRDPLLGRTVHGMRKLFPDAPVTETAAGHFLQEEVPEELAEAVLQVVAEAPTEGT